MNHDNDAAQQSWRKRLGQSALIGAVSGIVHFVLGRIWDLFHA